ncbi:MAG TPA: amino acid permease, partial [Cyclobacteriaceae bacterium]|nr:amino acid permease [Cyclobacteriaceae bacterium]
KASADGGPGIIFLFLFTAVACGFAAFAYAEFATRVPVSGSAYTYSYVAFGELAAWVIGWALIMEYAIGNITVAISWSDYFTGLLSANGIHLPGWMTMDYLTASRGFHEATTLMNSGKTYENLGESLQEAYLAWLSAPTFLGLHFVADLPALLIIILITWLVYRGIKETRNASNIFVAIKLSVVALVIIVGAFYIKTDNWSPFFPEGIGGILKGVSAVFFAYIGFDAISTTAEECRNPQRDLPMGMMLTLIICTVLYVAIALVLTGLVKYDLLAVGDPLAFVFEKIGLTWISGIVALSAVVAMASVLLVFQLGQPRIWMSMSRDGLLPPAFSRIHPKYKTPSFATIVTGFVVAVPALFMNLKMVTDLCSIGTLFAFVLVCAGVLRLDANDKNRKGKFRIPYFNSRYILPGILILTISLVWMNDRRSVIGFLNNRPMTYEPVSFLARLSPEEIEMVKSKVTGNREYISNGNPDLESFLSDMDRNAYESFIASLPLTDDNKTERGLMAFRHKVPIWIFIIITAITTWICFRKKLSLIPVLGFLSCFYMMAELGVSNWLGFSGWLVVGLIIYFTYGIKNSKLNVENKNISH